MDRGRCGEETSARAEGRVFRSGRGRRSRRRARVREGGRKGGRTDARSEGSRADRGEREPAREGRAAGTRDLVPNNRRARAIERPVERRGVGSRGDARGRDGRGARTCAGSRAAARSVRACAGVCARDAARGMRESAPFASFGMSDRPESGRSDTCPDSNLDGDKYLIGEKRASVFARLDSPARAVGVPRGRSPHTRVVVMALALASLARIPRAPVARRRANARALGADSAFSLFARSPRASRRARVAYPSRASADADAVACDDLDVVLYDTTLRDGSQQVRARPAPASLARPPEPKPSPRTNPR